MNYRNIGRTGLKVSEISLGAWLTYGGPVGQETTDTIVAAAIDAGVNYIDIADIYSGGKAEEMVGKAIKPLEPFQAGVVEQAVLADVGGHQRSWTQSQTHHGIGRSIAETDRHRLS